MNNAIYQLTDVKVIDAKIAEQKELELQNEMCDYNAAACQNRMTIKALEAQKAKILSGELKGYCDKD